MDWSRVRPRDKGRDFMMSKRVRKDNERNPVKKVGYHPNTL